MAKEKNGGAVDNKLKEYIEDTIDVSEQLSSQLDSMVDTYSDLGAGASKLLGIDKDLAILIEKQAQGVENMSDDEKKLLATKLKTVKANEDVAKSISGQLGFLKTFKNISKAINTVLMANPLLAIAAVVVAIIGLVVKLNGILNETMREFGTSAKESGKIAIKLKVAQFQGLKMGLTAEEIKGSFVAINDTLGGVNNASAKFITQLTDASVRTGTTAEEFSKILAIQESISSSTREQLMAQTELIRANIEISGILPASVFKDVAANTQAFAEFAKDGGKNVFDAALAAKKLGLNLSNVVGIADSLLNFEESIESQMNASMLIGRDINLDKARELALNNDLEGAMEEVVKQVGSEAEFNELNRIQRKALAESVGVNVEELSRMVRNQGKGEAARVGSATEEVAKKQDKMLDLTTNIDVNIANMKKSSKSISENTGEGGG